MAIATAAAQERSSTVSAWQQLRTFLYEELKPTPGRQRAALIRVAGVMLAMWFGYASNLPEVSAIVALAFFASSADHGESKKVALGVPPAVLVIMCILSLVLHIFGTEPLVRTLAFITIVFTSLFLLQAAQQGQIFLLAGIFGKLFLELWDSGYPGAVTLQLQSYIIIDLAAAGLCALLVSYLFGKPDKDPARDFRGGLAKRFELLARALAKPSFQTESDLEKLRAQTAYAEDSLLPELEAAARKNPGIRSQCIRFGDLIRISQLLLHETMLLNTDPIFAFDESREARSWSAERCKAIAHLVRSGSVTAATAEALPIHQGAFAAVLVETVDLAEQVAIGNVSLPMEERKVKKSFFRPDAFTNPKYLSNAARAFAAAFACYCLISGADWSGIGTAVTTCLITSLTTVEQSRQKQSLRIGGAAVGAVFAYFVLIFVLPAGIGIAGLSIVTAVVTFLGAWVYVGGPKLNYAGVQLALCYFLGIFGENKTPTSLTTIRDRIAGIFIGNLAMWLFYDRIRPAWTKDSARCAFAEEVEAIARMVSIKKISASADKLEPTLLRERDAFGKAHVAILTMGDTSAPAFSPWAKAQQKDAPDILHAEAQLNHLFSFAFVKTEARLLDLASLSDAHSDVLVSNSLQTLALNIRSSAPIEHRSPEAPLSEEFAGNFLLDKAQHAIARLFAEGKPNQG